MASTLDSHACWILVADRTNARLFRGSQINDKFELLREWKHPEGSLQSREIDTDRYGQTFSSPPGTKHGYERNGYQPPQLPEERIAEDFARELTSYLNKEASQGSFDWLFYVAPPKFLGNLREVQTPSLSQRMVGSVEKNLTKLRENELTPYFDNLVKEAYRNKLGSRESA